MSKKEWISLNDLMSIDFSKLAFPCSRCGGRGVIEYRVPIPKKTFFLPYENKQKICPDCNGIGFCGDFGKQLQAIRNKRGGLNEIHKD